MTERNARLRKRRRDRVIGRFLMIITVVLAVIMLATLIVLCTKIVGDMPEKLETSQELPTKATEGLTESVFLSNNLEASSGKVEVSGKEATQLKNWQKMMDACVNYHMTIIEQETYGANDSLLQLTVKGGRDFYVEEKDLGQTQTRQIDVYSTEDPKEGQWYLIKIEERDFKHSSQYNVMPGVYFFKADGKSPIYTIGGKVTGTEKEKLLSLLNTYLLPAYCNPENLAGKMGDLKTQVYAGGSEFASIILENTDGQVEISGKPDIIQNLTGQYSKADGSEVYQYTVEVSYGDTFDVNQVDLARENPYRSDGTMEEIQFWTGDDSQAVTLTDTRKANEVWSQIKTPEEYAVRATLNTTTVVRMDRERQISNQFIINLQHQILEEQGYTKVSVRYSKRELGESDLAAGTYIFNDEFIWTDRGVISTKDAPNLLKLLQAFSAETYLNVKWQTKLCGDLYLESFIDDSDYEISLIEKGDRMSGSANYARVQVNKENELESFQTHIRYSTEEKFGTSVDFGANMNYDREEIEFSIPKPIEN